jgi:hypothetical protein
VASWAFVPGAVNHKFVDNCQVHTLAVDARRVVHDPWTYLCECVEMSASGRPPRDPFALSGQAVELWEQECQEIGYLARVFAQTALPYKDPGPVSSWGRRNGNLRLTIQPGQDTGPGGEPVSLGYPFGSMPRLLLTWMSTEAVRTGERVLPLGESLSDFMRQLGLVVAGGKGGPITRLRDQMLRLMNARITVRYSEDGDVYQRQAARHLALASSYDLWWSTKAAANQLALIPSYVELTDEFFLEVTTRPVPVSLDALKLLRGSPLRLDIYAWLTHRMSYLRQPTVVPWESLRFQFGSSATTKQAVRKFRLDFLDHLAQVIALAYPAAKVDEVANGLRLRPSPTHVGRGARPALRPAPDPTP